MALRIGGRMPEQPQEAMLPEEPMDMPVEEAVELAPAEPGSAVEWLQEALDLCGAYQCPEDLAYALEQALVHLIGPSAVGATEPAVPPMEPPVELPAEPAAPATPAKEPSSKKPAEPKEKKAEKKEEK